MGSVGLEGWQQHRLWLVKVVGELLALCPVHNQLNASCGPRFLPELVSALPSPPPVSDLISPLLT